MKRALEKINDPNLATQFVAALDAQLDAEVRNAVDPVELCYEFAGIVGIHPEGRTLRELFMMASGKARFLGATSSRRGTLRKSPYNPAILQGRRKRLLTISEAFRWKIS